MEPPPYCSEDGTCHCCLATGRGRRVAVPSKSTLIHRHRNLWIWVEFHQISSPPSLGKNPEVADWSSEAAKCRKAINFGPSIWPAQVVSGHKESSTGLPSIPSTNPSRDSPPEEPPATGKWPKSGPPELCRICKPSSFRPTLDRPEPPTAVGPLPRHSWVCDLTI